MTKKELPREELRRAKEDLEDLEMYIEEFSTFLPLAVCSVSPVGIIININKAFEDLTGYRPIEIVGETLITLFSEKKEMEELLLNMVVGKELVVNKELTLITKLKENIRVNMAISSRRDKEGNFVGYFIGVTDVTELKTFQEKMEEKVRERTNELDESRVALMNILEDVEEARRRAEEERNKTLAIINNFTDGLLVFDEENKLSLINPQVETFFDIKARDIIGRTIPELGTFPTFEPLATLLGGEPKGIFRKELLTKENLALEVSTVSIISGEEKLGMLVVLRDITREKTVERMKTEFVSLAAHQLRTPLSAIKWTIRMLLDGDLGEITKEQRDLIEKTYSSNERMITLINDLLDITRIEEGRYLYRPALAQIENIVQFVINSYQEEIKKKNIKLEFKKSREKLPKIRVDVEKIRLAVSNLLDNAVRYTPSGKEVTISLSRGKKEIEFSIADSGVGIPADQQLRVFTKFFRGANVIRMETEGSGLGVFIAKNIIEAHNGKIWFESKEGKGTTFYFVLPIKEEFAEFLKEF